MATTGLLGAGYYGYHQYNTGHTIKRLVPEWEVASAGGIPSGALALTPANKPVCTKAPLDRVFAHAVPGFRFEQELPGSDLLCPLLGMPAGKVKVMAEGRQHAIPFQEVGATCRDNYKWTTDGVGRLTLCNLVLQLHGRHYKDHFRHRCKSCAAANAPQFSCTGLMCQMSSEALDLGVSSGVEKEWSRGPLKFKLRGDVGGLRFEAGQHIIRNGTDPRCGDCRKEKIDGVVGVERKDCVRRTLVLPVGSRAGFSLELSLQAGPFKGVGAGTARLGAELSATHKSGACGSGICLTGAFEVNGGWEIRAQGGPGVVGGATLLRQSCGGRWVKTSCEAGPGTVKSKDYGCNRVVHPGVGGDGDAGPFIY